MPHRYPFGSVNDDKVRSDAGLDHRLADGEKFPGMPEAEFETDRFSAGELTKPTNKLNQFQGVEKAEW